MHIMKHLSLLTDKNLLRARKMLLEVVMLLDKNGITYHLEGGTLLGIVRDNDLLPWDHDVDISIPVHEVDKFRRIFNDLYKKGYKVSKRKSKASIGPFVKGEYVLFKVKKLLPSFLKFVFSGYKKHYIVLDVFVKSNDEHFTYWQAQGKLLRVDSKFYESFETIDYCNNTLKVPNLYREYLTKKYGDWSVPVKDWECGKDEGTIHQAI